MSWQQIEINTSALAFVGGAFLLSIAGVILATDTPSDAKHLTVATTWILVVAFVQFAFLEWIDPPLFYLIFVPAVAAGLAPTAAVMLADDAPEGTALFALGSWLLLSFVVVFSSELTQASAEELVPRFFWSYDHWLRQSAYAFAVTALFFRLGTLNSWPFAVPLLRKLAAISFLLDLRLIAGALFVGLALVRSVVNSVRGVDLRSPWVNLGRLPPLWETTPLIVATFLYPFIVLANLGITVTEYVGNVLWKVVAATARLFVRVGVELARVLVMLARKWSELLTLLAALCLLAVAIGIGKYVIPATITYVRTDSWNAGTSPLWQLTKCVACFALVEFGLVLLNTLHGGNFHEVLESVLHNVALCVALFAFSAVPLYILAYYFPGYLRGFGHIGLFATIVLVLVGAGLVTQLARWSVINRGPS